MDRSRRRTIGRGQRLVSFVPRSTSSAIRPIAAIHLNSHIGQNMPFIMSSMPDPPVRPTYVRAALVLAITATGSAGCGSPGSPTDAPARTMVVIRRSRARA